MLILMERRLRKVLPNGEFLNVPQQHSRRMARIRSQGNRSTELPLRLALVRLRLRGWELHPSDIYGHPDFYFRRQRLAIFIDGCFWHQCPRCGHIPSTRTEYWVLKFQRNRARARNVGKTLARSGIQVIRFWEHDITANATKVALKLKKVVNPTNHVC